MRPPPDITDYLVPNNPGSLTTSNYSIATERTEIVSPESASILATIGDDKGLDFESSYDPLQQWAKANYGRQHVNVQPGYYSASPLPPVQTPNPMYAEVQVAPAGTLRNCKFVQAAPPNRPNSGVILSPVTLNNAGQSPSARYVNVVLNNNPAEQPSVITNPGMIPFTLCKSPLPNLAEESSVEAEQETAIV